MRNYLRHNVLSILGSFTRPSNHIHILNGHYISKAEKSELVFFELLEYLKKHVDFINIEEATELIKSHKTVSTPKVAFTFDDGFEECYTKIAPVLKAFNTNAAFFINPNFIECSESYKNDFLENKVYIENKNPMSWEMIKNLSNDGFIIGSHTLDHQRLNITDQQLLTNQIIKSKEIIESKINSKCDYFAYPYGQETDLSDSALEIALQTYKYIFTGFNHRYYFSFGSKAINRRHFEGDWSPRHMNYFLSIKKNF